MSELSSRFPEPLRESLVIRSLIPGRVLYLFCEFTVPPKEKYVVLLDLSLKSLLFIINSNIHSYISARPHLLASQLQLKVSSYDFLGHDSYLDCSNAIDDYSDTNIIDQLIADTSRIHGELTQADKDNIKSIVADSTTIANRHKTRILANF